MPPIFSEEFQGKAVGVASANIIKADNGELLSLYGIKSPAVGTELGKRAKSFVMQQVIGQPVKIDIVSVEYGIRYVKVTLADGKDLAGQMLSEGLATWDRAAWPKETHLGDLEQIGQSKLQAAFEEQQEKMQDNIRQIEEARIQKEKEERERAEKEALNKQIKEWQNTLPAERQGRRSRLYALWKTLRVDLAKAEIYYEKITKASQLLTLGADARAELQARYQRSKAEHGMDVSTEVELLMSSWDEQEAQETVGEWIQEYYALLDKIASESDEYTYENDLITELDSHLPEEVLASETIALLPEQSESRPETSGNFRVGTGFIVAEEGYVITCAHVIDGAKTIRVESKEEVSYPASVKFQDRKCDFAIIFAKSLVGSPIPVSTQEPEQGSVIYCLGYPLSTVKMRSVSGNIAGLEGAGDQIEGDPKYLQITAPLNPGNSGGPVLNVYGEWVGVVAIKSLDIKHLYESGQAVQGVNHAIKASAIEKQFNTAQVCAFSRHSRGPELSLQDICKQLSDSVVRVIAR